jgi:hypothetical protein
VSLDAQLPPPGQPQYQTPPPPPQPQGTSGLAIAGLILAFVVAPVGFILSLIAVFKTGAGKAKGRGLAIAGLIVSVLVMGAGIALIVVAANSTVADPGCVKGKSAILAGANDINPTTLQKTADDLKAAAAEAKHDDVRAALTALADDYSQLVNAMKTGNMPDGLEDKVNKDGEAIDSLCTISA